MNEPVEKTLKYYMNRVQDAYFGEMWTVEENIAKLIVESRFNLEIFHYVRKKFDLDGFIEKKVDELCGKIVEKLKSHGFECKVNAKGESLSASIETNEVNGVSVHVGIDPFSPGPAVEYRFRISNKEQTVFVETIELLEVFLEQAFQSPASV